MDGLVQERRISSALTMGLRLALSNQLICEMQIGWQNFMMPRSGRENSPKEDCICGVIMTSWIMCWSNAALDNKITEFDMINTKNSSTAYVVIYKLIT